MNDLISRQAVLDALKAIPDHNDGMVFETLSHALRDIELLPSAQQWISVSERLPERTGSYLVTVRSREYDPFVDVEYFFEDTWEWDNYRAEVIAWAELPEPYKEDVTK